MHEDLATLVHPVLRYGLDLHERLARGEPASLDKEQAALKGLLLTDMDAGRYPDFGGDPATAGVAQGASEMAGFRGGSRFLGVRYALACWLDEIFIGDSPWAAQWNEKKMEVALYGTNDRAWKFWEQAQLAEARFTPDALEAFFLCVILGFRGDLIEDLPKLQTWVSALQARLIKAQAQAWQPPAEREPPVHVPPLRGPEQLRNAILYMVVVLLIMIPAVAVLVVQRQVGQ
jgi:type VI secretion system protein ImpK